MPDWSSDTGWVTAYADEPSPDCPAGVYMKSVGHAPTEPEGHIRRIRLVTLREWSLWSAPRQVLLLVLAVDLAAVAAYLTYTATFTAEPADLVRFGVLLAGTVIHLEATRGIERLRETSRGRSLYANLKDMWFFAALLLLPGALTMTLIVLAYVYDWLRVHIRHPAHRTSYNVGTVLLGCTASLVVLDLAGSGPGGLPSGPFGLLLVIAVGVAYFGVNLALVTAVVKLSAPDMTIREILGEPSQQVVVVAGMGLGVAIASMLLYHPWLAAVLIVTSLCLHRVLLLPQFRAAARTDGKTGLLTAGFWHELAAVEIERAVRLTRPVAVLMIDLDLFKAINDRIGHLGGDQVIRAVADELRREIRPGDLVGRFGGEEFVMLLPAAGKREVSRIAERLRHRIAALQVPVTGRQGPTVVADMSVSIGVAVAPDDGIEIDQLLLAADTALFTAKDSGRNQVRLAVG